MLDLAVVLQLAVACAPNVDSATVAAIAYTESRFDPLAIGDNTTRREHSPRTAGEAAALASGLRQQGHSIDLGLMQINSANLVGMGLSVADTFDPCRSIAAGARVLTEAFAGGADPDAAQAALRVALSRYNTGDTKRGFVNGYVRRVEASALRLVPALRVTAVPPGLPPQTATPTNPGPGTMVAPAPALAADGEWHAGPSLGEAADDGDSEWHAGFGAHQPRLSETENPMTNERARPAPVVLLHGPRGSQP